MLRLKRVYDSPAQEDGYRVLVDRLWPRGISKDRAALDLWCKEAAPSPELRVWFGHDPAKFGEFGRRYRAELKHNPAIAQLHELIREHKTITLLYGARDAAINHAAVLCDYLREAA